MTKQTTPPADPNSGPVAQYGYQLRQLRQAAGLSYSEVAARGYYSRSAMHGVDQGHHLPTEQLVKQYVLACDGDPQPWLEQRTEIAAQLAAIKEEEALSTTPKASGWPAPDPTEVTSVAEYNDALKRLREWSGLTLRDIDERTADYPRRLAASTLCRKLKGGKEIEREAVASFVRVTGLSNTDQHTWLTVWDALHDGRPMPAEPTWRRWRSGARPTVTAGTVDITDPLSDPPPTPGQTLQPWVGRAPYTPSLSQIRDWVFENGRWRSTDTQPGPVRTLARWLRTLPWQPHHRAKVHQTTDTSHPPDAVAEDP